MINVIGGLQVLPYVLAEVFSLKVDEPGSEHALSQCLVFVFSIRRDAYHASAVCDDLAVLQCRAGMEDDAFRVHLVDVLNLESFLVAPWIAA